MTFCSFRSIQSWIRWRMWRATSSATPVSAPIVDGSTPKRINGRDAVASPAAESPPRARSSARSVSRSCSARRTHCSANDVSWLAQSTRDATPPTESIRDLTLFLIRSSSNGRASWPGGHPERHRCIHTWSASAGLSAGAAAAATAEGGPVPNAKPGPLGEPWPETIGDDPAGDPASPPPSEGNAAIEALGGGAFGPMEEPGPNEGVCGAHLWDASSDARDVLGLRASIQPSSSLSRETKDSFFFFSFVRAAASTWSQSEAPRGSQLRSRSYPSSRKGSSELVGPREEEAPKLLVVSDSAKPLEPEAFAFCPSAMNLFSRSTIALCCFCSRNLSAASLSSSCLLRASASFARFSIAAVLRLSSSSASAAFAFSRAAFASGPNFFTGSSGRAGSFFFFFAFPSGMGCDLLTAPGHGASSVSFVHPRGHRNPTLRCLSGDSRRGSGETNGARSVRRERGRRGRARGSFAARGGSSRPRIWKSRDDEASSPRRTSRSPSPCST